MPFVPSASLKKFLLLLLLLFQFQFQYLYPFLFLFRLLQSIPTVTVLLIRSTDVREHRQV